jgi:hypothetical protein
MPTVTDSIGPAGLDGAGHLFEEKAQEVGEALEDLLADFEDKS